MNKKSLIFILIILLLLLTFSLIRTISPKEIDDVSPEILCEQNYLKKSDILWVIPKFNNKPISENQTWCEQILNLNKTLGLHGVMHEFEEFAIDKNQEYLDDGIKIFEECFRFKPDRFKPPQLKISNENKELIKKNNIKLKGKFNQLFHKVYHCNDSGKFSNWIIDLF